MSSRNRASYFLQVKWEAEAKEAVKGSIDDRLRDAMENDSDFVYSDAPSPDPNEDPFDDQLGLGPKTPEPKESPPIQVKIQVRFCYRIIKIVFSGIWTHIGKVCQLKKCL